MRGYGLFFGLGRDSRNRPLKLENPRPVEDYGHSSCCTGDAGKDGFTTLSAATPDRQGDPPPIHGGATPLYWSSQDWEQ